MGKHTIKFLKKVSPEKRLEWSARLFWFSIIGGTLSVILVSKTSFDRILMGISWGAITITCVDVILTADVRDEEDGNS